MKRLRWTLARLFAPVPVMADPYPEENGVFIICRTGSDKGYSLVWTMRVERFRMKSTRRLAPLDFGRDTFVFKPSKTFTRFVGTVGDPEPAT